MKGCGKKITLKNRNIYCGDMGMHKQRFCNKCRKKILDGELYVFGGTTK